MPYLGISAKAGAGGGMSNQNLVKDGSNASLVSSGGDAGSTDDELKANHAILNKIRGRLKYYLDHVVVLSFIVGLVFLDIGVFVISLSDVESDTNATRPIYHTISLIIITIFVGEVVARIIVYGLSFFKDIWMVVDGIIVVASFVTDVVNPDSAGTAIVLLRMTRVARIALTMSKHGNVLRTQIKTMIKAKKGNQSPMEYCILSLKQVQTSGALSGAQIKEMETIIEILGSGNLFGARLQMTEADQQDIELKNFLAANFTDPSGGAVATAKKLEAMEEGRSSQVESDAVLWGDNDIPSGDDADGTHLGVKMSVEKVCAPHAELDHRILRICDILLGAEGHVQADAPTISSSPPPQGSCTALCAYILVFTLIASYTLRQTPTPS